MCSLLLDYSLVHITNGWLLEAKKRKTFFYQLLYHEMSSILISLTLQHSRWVCETQSTLFFEYLIDR